ncbi:MAG: GNAT family N-acetyltransferase [Actinobacteria bacterium]|nr:GNAT family N-acetyltransferase [Actinomycetota bacterium]
MSDPAFVPPNLVGTVTVFHAEEAAALIATGATLQRHAHQMRLALPVDAPDESEFWPFAPDATPPVPWERVMPSFEAAYPPEHPDHLPGGPAEPALAGLPGGPALIDSYLVPYTAGAKLGPLICHASALAVRDGHVYGGILVVDRPDEGAWVCDIWRDPGTAYAGTGSTLLRWSASRLAGHDSLGLVVTVGNDAALRAYERTGFTIESTAWTIRLP